MLLFYLMMFWVVALQPDYPRGKEVPRPKRGNIQPTITAWIWPMYGIM